MMVLGVYYSDRWQEYTIYLMPLGETRASKITTVTRKTVDLNRVKIGLVVNDPEDI